MDKPTRPSRPDDNRRQIHRLAVEIAERTGYGEMDPRDAMAVLRRAAELLERAVDATPSAYVLATQSPWLVNVSKAISAKCGFDGFDVDVAAPRRA